MTARTDWRKVLFLKGVISLIWLGLAQALYRSPWKVVFMVPPILMALFHLSLAVVQFGPNGLRFRRFLNWKTVDQSEIVSVGLTWPYFIGFVRLNRFLFPWGRLYFVLDKTLERNSSRIAPFILTQEHNHEPPSQGAATPRPRNEDKLRLIAAGLAGAVVQYLILFHFPHPSPRSALDPNGDTRVLIGIALRLVAIFGRIPIAIVPFAFFGFLLVRNYRKSDAWIYAFMTGAWLTFAITLLSL